MALTDTELARLEKLAKKKPPAATPPMRKLAEKTAETAAIVHGLTDLIGTVLAMRHNPRIVGTITQVGQVNRPHTWVEGGRRYRMNVPTPTVIINVGDKVVTCHPAQLLVTWLVKVPVMPEPQPVADGG